jgi:tRNA modification GTPase
MSHFDTIVAPITGSQPAAVAVIRLSGAEAWAIAAKVFVNWPDKPESHRAMYGRYITCDDGLALPFVEGHSYTGEQSVELSCHGSPASVRALVEACVKAGARPARPGEFTERSFLNGRMDLTEAEAVADTVSALTAAQLKIANLQREGVLHREVVSLGGRVLRILAAVEASVDFEEEIGPLDRQSALAELESVADAIEEMIRTAEIGAIVRRGLRIAIVGLPNAGKSSLLNAIVGRERAIVTSTPGTTRDYLEEHIDMGGVPVVLIDTAGLRQPGDEAEKLGVGRSLEQAERANLVWYVFDASKGITPEDEKLTKQLSNAFVIASKCDLARVPHFLNVSAKTGQGLDELVRNVTVYAEEACAMKVPPIDLRHKPLLEDTVQMLREAAETIRNARPDDLLTTFLRSASSHLGEITGETASADMIERIFADFCIGK